MPNHWQGGRIDGSVSVGGGVQTAAVFIQTIPGRHSRAGRSHTHADALQSALAEVLRVIALYNFSAL